MCNPAVIPYVLTAVGAAASYQGQRRQAAAFKNAQRQQEAHNRMQAALAAQQREENHDLGLRRLQSLADEAQTVSPAVRPPLVSETERRLTDGHVRDLQAANLLGADSIGAGADGRQSDAYWQERAQAAARQTAQAVRLARLFGAADAAGAARQQQGISALDHRLRQAAVDAERRSLNNGYDWLFDDLDVRRARARESYDPNKGAGLQAVGGALMNFGMQGIGSQWGAKAGKKAGNKLILDNLF